MAVAIPRVFTLALHKLCRWHMLKKFREPLGQIYRLHPSFRDEFRAIVNWPLMPNEFETAWLALVDEYNLENNTMMIALWEDRKEWISAYYKGAFCARMTSTQRSESMNYVLKKGFLKKKKLSLHRFVEQVNKCIQSRRMKEHEQTMANIVSALQQVTLEKSDASLSTAYANLICFVYFCAGQSGYKNTLRLREEATEELHYCRVQRLP